MQDSLHFRTPDDVETFFSLGQRIPQLTYNFNIRIGSGFLEQRDGGLSVFGLSILQRMEKVGMGVDVSHCGDQTTIAAADRLKAPASAARRRFRGVHRGRTAPSLPAET
jgi:membrane dipeptidase